MAQVLSDELLVLYFTRMVYGWVRIRLPCIGCREEGDGRKKPNEYTGVDHLTSIFYERYIDSSEMNTIDK